jgi:hypothetical protein
MEECTKHDITYKGSYCPVCSFAEENELLKENIKVLNEKIFNLQEEIK